MKKFIIIYHAPADSWDSTTSTPEEQAKGLDAIGQKLWR